MKNDMSRDEDFIGRGIETFVGMMLSGETQKNTGSGFGIQLVRGVRFEPRVTKTAKNTKMMKIGWMSKQALKRCGIG